MKAKSAKKSVSVQARALAWAERRFPVKSLQTQVWFNSDLQHDMACAYMLGYKAGRRELPPKPRSRK